MDAKLRDLFDMLMESVLAELPDWVQKLLDEVPLCVEDYPSREVMARMNIRHRDALCGLYTGVPLSERCIVDIVRLPDVVMIYREGIINEAARIAGHLTQDELRRQIRITVLHELGHYHGFGEEELEMLGYG